MELRERGFFLVKSESTTALHKVIRHEMPTGWNGCFLDVEGLIWYSASLFAVDADGVSLLLRHLSVLTI